MFKKLEKRIGRVAIVVDQMTNLGGADRELFSILKLFPNSDIYTILFDPKGYNCEIRNKVYTSFVQKIPAPKSFYRHLKIFTPLAYESFDLREYDLVISLSAGPGKGIITGIDQKHIAMVMTPPRSLWDKELNARASWLRSIYHLLSIPLNNYMRIWDISISKRVDHWISNSKYIQKKVKKTYGVDSSVVYPGIEDICFEKISEKEKERVRKEYDLPKDFVFIVSRLYDYKRIDWAIEACIKNNKRLVISGSGPDMPYLKKISNENIKFLGFVKSDHDVRAMLSMSECLLFCGIEDFGLVPIESMAQGTPVLAYREGGVSETVLEGSTGEFFNNKEELIEKLKVFKKKRYNPNTVISRAKCFSEDIFLNNLEKEIERIYEKEI